MKIILERRKKGATDAGTVAYASVEFTEGPFAGLVVNGYRVKQSYDRINYFIDPPYLTIYPFGPVIQGPQEGAIQSAILAAFQEGA